MRNVGSRPPIARDDLEYNLRSLRWLKVTRGITELRQFQARQDLSFGNYTQFDTTNIGNWSTRADLKINAHQGPGFRY